MRGVSHSSGLGARSRVSRRPSTRRLRQRWRWVPLPVRLKAAQLRARVGHRRGILKMAGLVVVIVVLATRLSGASSSTDSDAQIAVPEGHSVLSIAVDDGVPPLKSGDLIDLYLSVPGFAGTEAEITKPVEPSAVISSTPDALIVAVPDDEVAAVAAAISAGSVLVVRR